MPKENLTIFTRNNLNVIPVYMYKAKYIIAIILSIFLLTTGCKKTKEVQVVTVFEQYFEQNILNRDFIVSYAKDQGTEITTQFDGYIFKLFKNTYYDGPMTAIKSGVTYSGTWSSNSDYGNLIINLNQPSIPNDFIFINRQWRFTSKALPVMKLAPWGSTDSTELYMQRL